MRPGISDAIVERFQSLHAHKGKGHVTGALDAFFAAASAGLVLVDQALRCVQINDEMAEIAQQPPAELLGRPLGDFLPAGLEPRVREVMQTGAAIERAPFELHGRSYVGTFFPIYADEESITGLGGIIIDVTEHRRLEHELRAACEMRERVLAVVSHDLRNPLGTIQLAISTMPPAVVADRDAQKRVDIIQRATKMMETLICDLLDIATIQAGRLELRRSHENAHALVRDVIELHAPLAEEKGIVLVDSSQLAGVKLDCDRARMSQVLSNLCGNAIKFCKAGDHVAIGGRADGDRVMLEVMDTGPGIPVADIPHLFEPYWSTARGRQRGTGLGLFICKAIVDAHGGQLVVDSTVGRGTTFRMYLQSRRAATP